MPYSDRETQLAAQRRLSRERKQVRLDFVNNYKAMHGCKYCGEHIPVVLDLHHRGDSRKEDNVSVMVNKCRPIEEIKDEIKKCDVVCANCHRKIHAGLI